MYRALLHRENAPAEAGGRNEAMWTRSSGGRWAKDGLLLLLLEEERLVREGSRWRRSRDRDRKLSDERECVNDIWLNWIEG